MSINTDKLYIGLEVKNYNTMCQLLNESAKPGKSKQIQQKEWKRYFDWEKAGHKFIITDIYDTPLPKNDGRAKGNHNIYVKYIEVLLLNLLANKSGYKLSATKNQLLFMLGMINQFYNNDDKKKEIINTYADVTKFEMGNFYLRCNSKLDKILFAALNNLERRFLISYTKETVIIPHIDSSIPVEPEPWIASDEEVTEINEIKHGVLNSMGYESIIQVYYHGKDKEFFQKVNKELIDMYNYEYVYNRYKILYTQEDCVEELPHEEVKLNKLLLNGKILNAVDSQAQRLFFKNEEDYKKTWHEIYDEVSACYGNFGKPNPKSFTDFRYPPQYVEVQKFLSEQFIRLKSENLSP